MTRVLMMAVPWDLKRVKRVKEVREQVPHVEVVWDEQKSIMDTFTRALSQAGTDPAIFLQDDVFLHPQWTELTAEAIEAHPRHLIQFFSMRPGDLNRTTYLEVGSKYLMNQCFYLPRWMAADLLPFAHRWIREHPGHTGDDSCLNRYLVSRKLKYVHHVPSLVQHEAWESVTGDGRSTKRQSLTFDATPIAPPTPQEHG